MKETSTYLKAEWMMAHRETAVVSHQISIHPMVPYGVDCMPQQGYYPGGPVEGDVQTMRAEQQDVNEQLLTGLQTVLDSGPGGGSGHLDASTSVSRRSLKRVQPVQPPKAPRGRTDQSHQSQDQSCTSIPDVVDLERTLMMSESAQRRRKEAKEAKEAKRSVVYPDPVCPEPPETEPPRYEERQVEPNLSRRGSDLGILNRNSQSRILTPKERPKSEWKSFEESIGVSMWIMWINWSNWMICFVVLINATYIATVIALQVQGLQEASEQFAAFALLVYNIVAILFLKLVKRALLSEELNVAMQRLDEFVQDCGHGLDWASMAKISWRRFLALWLFVFLAFVAQQTLEVWMAEELGHEAKTAAVLRIAKAATGSFLFAVSSAVVMNGMYWQFTLVQGLQKTVDCWCADLMAGQDFVAGITSWNSLQALLKCVGREITPCFLALCLFGHAGFFASIAGSFSLLMVENLDGHGVAIREFALLPLIYLFLLSVQLFTAGAGLTKRCHQVPAFVNQLGGETEPDAERQYLVGYIANSGAGFIVYGVTLSQNALLKQMHLLTAVCSGFGGILFRRFLAEGS